MSVSSRGRVGVHAGPFSVSGGGRSGSGGFWAPLLGFLLVIALVFVAVMWPLSTFGHAVHLTPSWHQLMHRHKAWMHEHYPLVGLRYVGAAILLLGVAAAVLWPLLARAATAQQERAAAAQREQHAAYERWLAAPPEPIAFPGRFTQNWIQANVPGLHPGQVTMLYTELRARGWSDDRIHQRVWPFVTHH